MRIELELSSYGGAKVSSGLRRHVAAARFRGSAEPRVWGRVGAGLYPTWVVVGGWNLGREVERIMLGIALFFWGDFIIEEEGEKMDWKREIAQAGSE